MLYEQFSCAPEDLPGSSDFSMPFYWDAEDENHAQTPWGTYIASRALASRYSGECSVPTMGNMLTGAQILHLLTIAARMAAVGQ